MYNRAILIGRLVADPELRTTPQGTSVCSFRIAVDRPYQAKGAERKADFLNIVAWRQTAEFVSRFFSKGRLIGVEGSIQTGEYTDKEGNKRYTTDIVADRCFFTESKASAEGSSYNSNNNSNGSYNANNSYADNGRSEPTGMGGVSYQSGSGNDFQIIDDDDLPF